MTPEPAIKTDDDWQREATANAIAAAREVVKGGSINGRALVSSLSDIEWGWIVCAAIFGWIETKAKQAVEEGRGYDGPIRSMSRFLVPAPWESGAIASILPDLGNVEGLDWSKPLGEWSKDQIVSFVWAIHCMSNAALAARDEATDKIVRFLKDEQEREVSAANKGPLMSRAELNDEIPF